MKKLCFLLFVVFAMVSFNVIYAQVSNLAYVQHLAHSVNIESSTCPISPTDNSPDFCTGFPKAAECQCSALPIHPNCSSTASILDALTGSETPTQQQIIEGCTEKALPHTKSGVQQCIAAWSCYVLGGTDHYTHNQCSRTGKSCV